jgi:hypothetical protein
VSTTSTVVPGVPGGTTARTVVSESSVTSPVGTAPKVTVGLEPLPVKEVPVRSTIVPPRAGACDGSTLVMTRSVL